jgi:hypothetical protein
MLLLRPNLILMLMPRVACVIGKKGPKENLPSELQNKELPTDRKSLNEIVMEGIFSV